MIPIEALLHRIRWDAAFGRGAFTIGYYDRMRRGIVYLPLDRVRLEPGNHFAFGALDADGAVHAIPFHRVREVQRDGERIWQRRVRSDAV